MPKNESVSNVLNYLINLIILLLIHPLITPDFLLTPTKIKVGNKILLQDELDNVQTYIDLQLFLHPDRFTVDYVIDEELLHVPIIHLLLQPIVENAIEHGFSQDLDDQLLSIKIQRETLDIFSIKIEDNGIGFNVQELDNILVAKTHGYGLSNINQRIKFYFGDKYGLLFDSSEGMGTLVTILLPILAGDSDIKEF